MVIKSGLIAILAVMMMLNVPHYPGDVYESELFGLRFDLPDGWYSTMHHEIPDNYGIRTYFNAWNNFAGQRGIHVFMRFWQDTDATIESIVDARNALSESFAQEVYELNIRRTFQTTIHQGTTRIGAHYWHSYSHRIYNYMSNFGTWSNHYEHNFIRIYGEVIKSILIMYSNTNELRDVLEMLGICQTYSEALMLQIDKETV